MKFIDISKCKLLTTEGIETFLSKVNPDLEVFIASHLKCVTDSVMDLIFRFPSLSILDLSYNSALTEEFFTKLAGSQMKLAVRILKLDGLKCMDSKLLQKILK